MCAGCNQYKPGFAILIGIFAGGAFVGWHHFMILIQIDDPLDAVAGSLRFAIYYFAIIFYFIIKPEMIHLEVDLKCRLACNFFKKIQSESIDCHRLLVELLVGDMLVWLPFAALYI